MSPSGIHISQLGEFGLIKRVKESLPIPPAEVVVGIGDDVAVLKTSGSDYLLATCDAQVENVHFVRGNITPYQLGQRIAAVNLSDIAAMAGTPLWALVSLALPNELDTAFVDALYEGMIEQLNGAGAVIVGGNMSRIDKDIVIDLCLLGMVAPENLLLRSGAQVGDLVLTTGWLGDSRAGLELIQRPELIVPESSRMQVEQRHLVPQPRLREGQQLGASHLVHAMVDVSDGLLGDIGHICRASQVGAEIWRGKLPVSSACKEVAQVAGEDVSLWALTGGEDYELLFTISPEASTEIQEIIEERTGTRCHIVGRILDAREGIQVCLDDGKRMSLPEGSAGWDHFGSQEPRAKSQEPRAKSQELRAKS
jgi:thiamine-monophosphate kinase